MIKELSEQHIQDINAILTAATILEETIDKHTAQVKRSEYVDLAEDAALDAIRDIIRGRAKE